MERTLTWIRDNPQFAAVTFTLAVLALVMAVLAIVMLKAGASLRPLVWFTGFFAIVAGPQAVVHLLDGVVLKRARAPRADAPANAAGGGSLSPVAWDVVFGSDADPALITDAKRGLHTILDAASEAKLSFNREGESALAARFPSPAAAERARDIYGRFFAFAQVEGSDAQGWTARRHAGQGEWVHLVTAGSELYAWTSVDRNRVLARRAVALGAWNVSSAAAPAGQTPALVSKRLSAQVGLMAALVSLNLVAAGLWFFKGSAWAARVDGSVAAKPVSRDSLRAALLALNHADRPVQVTERNDGRLEVNWRYADARWFDLMRDHQLKRTQRLVLELDEANFAVRVREYWSAFDASAGPSGAQLAWTAATGIQFFAFEHRRVFGAELGREGRPTGELSHAYTFDLQAMKGPIISAVTHGGWSWQPVTWNAPAGLRWLTE